MVWFLVGCSLVVLAWSFTVTSRWDSGTKDDGG